MDVRMASSDEVGQDDVDRREEHELRESLKHATIGEYDIYSQLGRGGMATVFLALELSLNRPVAIKVISPSALSSTTVIERFWLEARTAAALSHPHVIPIYSVRAIGGLHFFVMKHVQGGSLDVVLKNEGPFAFWLARTILGQVAGALAYAHRRGVVHRDIKPANIMLDDEGFAIVTDFGIAKVRDAAALTASGSMVGTPFYMSPEQFSGEAVDGRSDQYSLGVVAFELLTGRRPFKGDSVPEVLRGHLIDRVPDIREFRRDCPTSLATLVNRMLSKASADRFPSMEAVCGQLDAMPRINSDQAREKIISLARTASMSSPQINQPVSPSPLSRTLAKSKAMPSAVSETASLASATASFRRRPLKFGAVGALAVGVAWFVIAANMGRTQRADDATSGAAIDTSLASTAQVASPAGPAKPQEEAEQSSTSAPDTPLAKAETVSVSSPLRVPIAPVVTITKPETRKSAAALPRQLTGSQGSDERTDRRSERADPIPVPRTFTGPAEVVPPPPPPPTAFGIGSRNPAAFLYVDGEQVGRIGRLRYFQHQPGRIHLQIQAEDCLSWDTVMFVKQGDTATVGYRNPRCTR